MQELERILMKRHKVGQRELSLGRYILHRYMNVFQRKYVSERHAFVCCLGQHITYFSIITVCPCLLLIFSFLNQVSASLTKAQIPLKLGTPEILC